MSGLPDAFVEFIRSQFVLARPHPAQQVVNGLRIIYEHIPPGEGGYLLERAFDALFEETLRHWKQGKN